MLKLSFVKEVYSMYKEEVVLRTINELELADMYSNEYKKQLNKLVELEKEEITTRFTNKFYIKRLIKETKRTMENTIFEYDNCMKEANRLFSMRSKLSVKTRIISNDFYLG